MFPAVPAVSVASRGGRVRGGTDEAPMDLTKRDMTVVFGGRSFAVRAYRDGNGPDGPGWHAVVIENRTPLRHALAPALGPATCFAVAVRFLANLVESEATPT